MEDPTAYPLAWPHGRKRSSPTRSQFKTGLPGAIRNVNESLKRFGTDTKKPINGMIVSSNVSLGNNKPDDAGVAVYFQWDERRVCIAVDRYNKVQCNLQAIHHILEARRTEMRHGGIEIVRASFEGFKALPAPISYRHWTEVLSLKRDAGKDEIKAAVRDLAKQYHPDKPDGSVELMSEINRASDEALAAWHDGNP